MNQPHIALTEYAGEGRMLQDNGDVPLRRVRAERLQVPPPEAPAPTAAPPADTILSRENFSANAFRFGQIAEDLKEESIRNKAALDAANAHLEQYRLKVAEMNTEIALLRAELRDANQRTEAERDHAIRLEQVLKGCADQIAAAPKTPER
jgi:hypothetical protein